MITGYNGAKLLCPEYKGAQRPPKKAPKYAELETLYIFGRKTALRYGLVDGLKRIVQVMERNIGANTWSIYIEIFGTLSSTSLNEKAFQDLDVEEKKARMKRLQKSMWDVMNTHNFCEVFRHCYHDDLRNPALDVLRKKIDYLYGYTHGLSAALITLADQADWKHYYANNYTVMIELTLSQIAKNDEGVLECIKQAIAILEDNTS